MRKFDTGRRQVSKSVEKCRILSDELRGDEGWRAAARNISNPLSANHLLENWPLYQGSAEARRRRLKGAFLSKSVEK